ncbi:PriCT-2 domain-containing protein [Magnetospirillum sp. 15-1]|uniref:PriCT-2 domain-containing protein n=1 Tax=Magnetospirillum sp. 15-1 TaxID=1979370 RepID=UPI000BBBD3B5|nr:PriCT-2 domain-containing protein [Magnetospirillum sp. 15-1]
MEPPLSSSTLVGLRRTLRRNGYLPVPISDAHLSIKAAGKRPLMRGWETLCAVADEAEIERWANKYPDSTNTGLLCGTIVGIDIDVPVEQPAAEIEQLARDMLGDTPLKRIGRAPKLLLVMRAAPAFDKIQTPELLLPDGTSMRVEILATGQQFVGFGIHPDTQLDYAWPDHSPLEVPASDLPVVSAEQCADFIAEAETVLRGLGGQTRAEIKGTERAGRKAAGLPVGAIAAGVEAAPDRETVTSALAHIPNDDLPYDDWIKVGFALYAGLGSDGADLWESWSAQSAKNDPIATADKWPGFAAGRSIGVGSLFWRARQNGWERPKAARPRTPRQSMKRDWAPSGRPTIRITAGDLPRVVSEGEMAMMNADLPLYQRGSMVVRPASSAVTIADGHKVNALRLVVVNRHHISEAMTFAANWERFDARAEDWVSTDCPLRIADTYLAREGMWKLPVLTGIINAPTLRADGSLLDQPGYDAATGLLYDPQGRFFPTIPAHPDRGLALSALRFLRGVIETFPFVTGADRAVALSGMLTATIRRSLPAAPLHGFNAPTAGSGKSLLVDIASMIASGRPAAVIAQGKTEEEMEKRLGATLIAGDPLISIDNCEIGLGGELLCQVLTQPMLKVRLLGKSLNIEVPSTAMVFATGNNLTVVGDMTRRAIRCTLDAGVERPELREFDRDPVATVTATRGDYVAAALTILRAFHLAGRPQQTTPLGSFTEWSRWVRDGLIWLGEADPCATMEEVRGADPKLEALTTVIEQWHTHLGSRRVSVKEVIDVATDQAPGLYTRGDFINPEFREALLAVAGDGGAINGRRLGKWLSANQGRIVNTMRIVPDGIISGISRWRLRGSSDEAAQSMTPASNIRPFSHHQG